MALCAGYQQGPGNTGLNLLTGGLTLLPDRLPGLSRPLEHGEKYREHMLISGILTRPGAETVVF